MNRKERRYQERMKRRNIKINNPLMRKLELETAMKNGGRYPREDVLPNCNTFVDLSEHKTYPIQFKFEEHGEPVELNFISIADKSPEIFKSKMFNPMFKNDIKVTLISENMYKNFLIPDELSIDVQLNFKNTHSLITDDEFVDMDEKDRLWDLFNAINANKGTGVETTIKDDHIKLWTVIRGKQVCFTFLVRFEVDTEDGQRIALVCSEHEKEMYEGKELKDITVKNGFNSDGVINSCKYDLIWFDGKSNPKTKVA
jgi:hypothetical protein